MEKGAVRCPRHIYSQTQRLSMSVGGKGGDLQKPCVGSTQAGGAYLSRRLVPVRTTPHSCCTARWRRSLDGLGWSLVHTHTAARPPSPSRCDPGGWCVGRTVGLHTASLRRRSNSHLWTVMVHLANLTGSKITMEMYLWAWMSMWGFLDWVNWGRRTLM